MNKNRQELKKGMALPPINHPPVREGNKSHRNKNRVRVEITPKVADILLNMLSEKMKVLDIEGDEFHDVLILYRGIKKQLVDKNPS